MVRAIEQRVSHARTSFFRQQISSLAMAQKNMFQTLAMLRSVFLTGDSQFIFSGKPINKPGPTNGPAATPALTTTEPPLPEENDVCSIPTYDTFFMGPDKRTYAIKGTQYWIIKDVPGAGLESGPHRVKDLWKELPNRIDAAYTFGGNRLVFFSGSK